MRLRTADAGLVPAYLSFDDVILGGTLCLCLIVTDLTEQKRNEAIVAEERLARSVLEQAGEAILVVDPHGRVVRSNLAADILAWLSVRGLGFDEVFQISLPDGIPCTFRDILAQTEGGEAVRGIEATAFTHDGRTLDLRVSASAISHPGGGVMACVVTLTDFTELKRAEEQRRIAEAVAAERQRLNDVLEQLPVMVCLLTQDHQVRFANRLFRELFGEANGRRCFEYVAKLPAPCPQCQAFLPLETHAPHRWEWAGPEGTFADVYNLPFTDVDGSPLILEVDVDITERKRTEAELARHREHLEALVKERTRVQRAASRRDRRTPAGPGGAA
jgi:PAS domain S-box-containing protein